MRALRSRADRSLPDEPALLRTWKRWESGRHLPDEFYQPLIAKTFGTVTAALFPPSRRTISAPATPPEDNLDVLARLRSSSVDQTAVEALRITTDRLCSDYRRLPAAELHAEGASWLRRITGLLDRRLTLAQHREVLTLAGWVALLVGCVEYDLGHRTRAEANRRAAFSLGQESEHTEIMAWAYEMQAWRALTSGDYPGVVRAAEAGRAMAPTHGVAIQLAAQQAKAWARLGERRHAESALESGRRQLEAMPRPENPDHHFVVDPGKFDFYAMDCYRLLGEDRLAEAYAQEVIRAGTDLDGTARTPMRIAEARLTFGVAAARRGDAAEAAHHGHHALSGARRSIPSLLMVAGELERILVQRHPTGPATQGFTAHLTELRRQARPSLRT